MPNWEYEIVIGAPGEVKAELNRLGALDWEIAATDVLAAGSEPSLLVYLKRRVKSDVPESAEADLHDFPVFRPHNG